MERVGAKAGVTLRYVDFLRDRYQNYIYIKDKASLRVRVNKNVGRISLYALGTDDISGIGRVATNTSRNLIASDLSKGFYQLWFRKNSNINWFRTRFQSDPYPCPFPG